MKREFDFQEEEIILIEKATKRKEEEFQKRINKQKAYLLRRDILLDYFKHMSSPNKEKFIKDLIDSITSLNLASALLNFLSIVGDAKVFVYSTLINQTDFKYDKFVLDHNRGLSERELQVAIDSDTQWFHSLDVDEQVDVIISLVHLSGGHIQRNLFFPVYRKCINKKEKFMELLEQETPDKYKITLTESEEAYSDHPATIEVENRRKNWNQIISKYREKVEGGRAHKDRPMRDKVSAEKSNTGKSKDFVKSDAEGTDWVQLLPVWIVKKIFSYFDQKNLQKLKKVNAYWSLMSQEVVKERKLRMQLNKEIQKMNAEIGPDTLEETFKSDKLPMNINPKVSRRIKYYERGAVVKKLLPQATEAVVQNSLISDVLKEISEDYFTEKIVSFSRQGNSDAELHRHQPCFLRDVNVVLGEQEDIKLQKSFLTYSLSSHSGSLDLTVDRQTLEDW